MTAAVTYHPLCYPAVRLDTFQKELTGKKILYILSIVAFVAVVIAAIVLTSIFSPTFLFIAILAGGIGSSLLFGLALAKIKHQMGILNDEIKLETRIIEKSKSEKDQATVAIEKIDLKSRREELVIRKFSLSQIESKNFARTMKMVDLGLQILHIEKVLKDDGTNLVSFEEMFVQTFKGYTPDQINQMIDDKLPYCTHVLGKERTPWSWSKVKLEANVE
jgi:hypothetical protein